MIKIRILWPTIAFPLPWENYNIRIISETSLLLVLLEPCLAPV